jgi:hypothetical protein
MKLRWTNPHRGHLHATDDFPEAWLSLSEVAPLIRCNSFSFNFSAIF